MLMNGVLLKRRNKKQAVAPAEVENFAEPFVEEAGIQEQQHVEYNSLIFMLMEMTSDLDGFENKVKNQCLIENLELLYDEDTEDIRSIKRPKVGDLSTLWTLIAVWLHNGAI